MGDYKDFFGGKRMPERDGPRRERFRICYCGDPLCPQGPDATRINDLRASGVSLDEITRNSVREGENPMASSRDSADDMMRFIARQLSIPRDMIASVDPAKPSEPAALTEARKAVDKYLLKAEHSVQWNDVIGNERAKEALLEAIEEPTRNRELYEFYGMTPPKGVLLYGPPGCGKTMFAKASATAMSRIYGKKVEILALAGSDIQTPWIGGTEKIIRELFEFARQYRAHHGHPCIIFIDEAETILPDRTGRFRRVAPWEESQVGQFLSEMDGMKDFGAFVILATNRPEAIDEALLRDGRCDLKIKVDRPNKAAAGAILYGALRDVPTKLRLDDLVFAAVEAFHDPAFVIHEGKILLGKGEQIEKEITTNMCLEHIINGAMLQGVARRAKSLAFRRDRNAGTRDGITVQDIIDVVREIYDENKDLEHAFATEEFIESVKPQAQALMEKHNQSKGKLQ